MSYLLLSVSETNIKGLIISMIERIVDILFAHLNGALIYDQHIK
ncbi:MAG: hypothetical protein ACI89T_000434 [Cognaticolwellia sp.]|jgi:hypothetical protein